MGADVRQLDDARSALMKALGRNNNQLPDRPMNMITQPTQTVAAPIVECRGVWKIFGNQSPVAIDAAKRFTEGKDGEEHIRTLVYPARRRA